MGKEKKNIAVISAMEVELSYVDEYLSQQEGFQKIAENQDLHEEKNIQIITKVLGVGKVNAAYQTADLITEFQPELIINVGYAGGLGKNAKRGDVAIGTEYVQVDFIPYLESNRPQIADSPKELVELLEQTAKKLGIPAVSGKIATGDFFLHDTKQKEELIKEFHPIAFDMESAAIAQVATGKGVEFVSIRTFSDLADDHAVDAFENGKLVKEDDEIPLERRPVVLALTAVIGECLL